MTHLKINIRLTPKYHIDNTSTLNIWKDSHGSCNEPSSTLRPIFLSVSPFIVKAHSEHKC